MEHIFVNNELKKKSSNLQNFCKLWKILVDECLTYTMHYDVHIFAKRNLII